MLNTQ